MSKGKKFRDAFVESEIDVGVAIQIKVMRESRGWTQEKLAAKCGKRQSVISQLEDINYGGHTLNTLKIMAAAFDVGLMVRFVAFSDLVRKATSLDTSDLELPEFSNDSGFSNSPSTSTDTWEVEMASSFVSTEDEGSSHFDYRTNIEDVDFYASKREVTTSGTSS